MKYKKFIGTIIFVGGLLGTIFGAEFDLSLLTTIGVGAVVGGYLIDVYKPKQDNEIREVIQHLNIE